MKVSRSALRALALVASLLCWVGLQPIWAQQTVPAKSAVAPAAAAEPQAGGQPLAASPQVVPALPVPRLVKFSGVVKDAAGAPRTGTVGLTFSIYQEQEGGATLWMETQNVELDGEGRYSVLLGSTQSEGMPLDLFASGDPRWLGVRVELPGEVEQARVLLVSVPYALKASDADTLGGKPASAFALAPTETSATTTTTSGTSTTASATSPTTTKGKKPASAGTETMGFIPMFIDTTGDLGNSLIEQSGSAIGIGESPVQTLDVNGGIRASTGLATGNRNTSADAINTNALFLNGSNAMGVIGTSNAVFAPGVLFTKVSFYAGNGSTTAERITVLGTNGFVGIGNTSPGQMLSVAGTIQSTSGGFMFPDGSTQTTAATGGGGSITAVNTPAGGGLTGGVTTGAANLTLLNTCSSGQVLQWTGTAWACSTVSSGAGVTSVSEGTGIVASPNPIQGSGTISIDTTVVPQLNAGNTFSGMQTIAVAGSGITALSVQATDLASANTGVDGLADGTDGAGVIGEAENGSTAIGVWGISSSGVAGEFSGNVQITGSLSKAGGSFQIDDPLDPANKYLYHSFVESPDMKNIYDGVVQLDSHGQAVVILPDWFQALNKDFRYQLTCIGGFAPVYIAQEIAGNQFKIAGGKAGMKVSWAVTGIRQDAWANANRIPVEQDKPSQERGYYLHPSLYGEPPEKSVDWARHAEILKRNRQTHSATDGPAQ